MDSIGSSRSAPPYRNDIDGLRAVAVLLVVFCHLGWTSFAGGYVGVDVFFVISGYLISGILLRELEAGTFSFAAFYERRVRRIAPALLVTLAVTALLARHYMFAEDLTDFSRSLLAALFSVSNFYFMRDWRYFDPENQARPLLHTWSLAVEEQYYLVFPLVLVAIIRWWPGRRRMIVWLLAAASLVAACAQIAVSHGKYNVAFFFSPLRAWELLLGTMLYDVPRLQRAWQRHVLSVIGLAAVLVPALLYTEQTPFPGVAALPPCLGAAMLIAAGSGGTSAVGAVLSWRPIRFIGLISYSLYLVHWPLIVLQRDTDFVFDAELHSRRAMPFILGLSLVLATILWRFVEMPFRKGVHRLSRRSLYIATGTAFALLVAFAGLTMAYRGEAVPHLAFTQTAVNARYARFDFKKHVGHAGICIIVDGPFTDFTPDTCLTTDPKRKNWLLFGDSHADNLYEGLATVFPEANVSIASMAGCWPMVEPAPLASPACRAMNSFIFKDYLVHHPVDLVLLDCRLNLGEIDALVDTVHWLQSHRIPVVVVSSNIEFDAPLPRLILIGERQHSPLVFTNHLSASRRYIEERYRQWAATRWHVPFISMLDDLCDPGAAAHDPAWQLRTASGCPIYARPDAPLLLDTNHLTPAGSVLFAEAIRARHQLPIP